MGQVIRAKADVARIEDHVRRTLRTATARGEEIAQAAENRLALAVAGIDSTLAQWKAANEVEATARAALLVEATKANERIGAVRDAMWNALGRIQQSAFLEQVFPGGVRVYTFTEPRLRPVVMQVLHSRILSSQAPRWTEAMRTAWAAEVEAARVPFEAAIAAHRPAEAAALVADVAYRSAVRNSHSRLRAFKRDLETLGLSAAQITAIIPDATIANGSDAGQKDLRNSENGGSTRTTTGQQPGTGAGTGAGATMPDLVNTPATAGSNGVGSGADQSKGPFPPVG